jgi:hypothetical protein
MRAESYFWNRHNSRTVSATASPSPALAHRLGVGHAR